MEVAVTSLPVLVCITESQKKCDTGLVLEKKCTYTCLSIFRYFIYIPLDIFQ
jgi:hypothetical protein